MKKIAIGLLAVVIAVGSVAFTNATKSAKFACNSANLIWYTVSTGNGLSINPVIDNAIGATDLAKLNQNLYVDLNALGTTPGDNSVTSADFPNTGTFDRIFTQTEYSANCPTGSTYKCAVAFYTDDLSKFEIVSGQLIPKSTAVVACVVTRSTAP